MSQMTGFLDYSRGQRDETQPVTDAVRWRKRVTYIAMSLVAGWHTIAIVTSPLPPGSGLVQFIRSLMQPYMRVFRVDNQWSFFAPKVGRGGEFRYVVEASDGKRHVIEPSEEPRQSISHYFMWREWKYLYDKVLDSPEERGYLIAGLLCKKHSTLNPVSISLLRVNELDFTAENYLEGYRHYHSRFIQLETLANINC